MIKRKPAMPRRTYRRRRKRHSLRLPIVILALTLFALFLVWSNRSLQTEHFTYSSDHLPAGFDGCTIVHLSDLHGAEFGEDNADLLSAVREAQPEYIFVTGDLLDRFRKTSAEYAVDLCADLAAIAPTYYVTGNHEWALGNVRTLKSDLRETGTTVLTNEFLTLERNGDTILLAGIDDPNGFADQKTPEQLFAEIEAAAPDAFTLLLAHRGNRFPTRYSLLGADLVLSGHGHGGVWRLPFTDGLIGNEFELFPSYMAGFYEENGSMLFATRGLGNSGRSFRIGNRPEIAVLTLHTKQ